MRKIFNSHWCCIVPLLPFVVMLAIQRAFNWSDSFGGVPAGGRHPTTAEFAYTCLLILVFYLGVGGFLAHVVFLRERGTGTAWLILKVAALALAWCALVNH
jgi:hypothetical protein